MKAVISLQHEFIQRSQILIILNLNSKQLHDLLPNLELCWHAFIIADAYNEHSLWSSCLIEQFICNRNSNANEYWNEFQQLISIDDQLILSIANNY